MKYTVISPKNKLVCFDTKEQVAQYCMEKDTLYLDRYFKDQELKYENMTPVEIGYGYVTIGAEEGGCRIFSTKEILEAMKENAVEDEIIHQTKDLLDNERKSLEINCPGYLEDLLAGLTPIPLSSLVGNIYTCFNTDGMEPMNS